MEYKFHNIYKSCNVSGEWFKIDKYKLVELKHILQGDSTIKELECWINLTIQYINEKSLIEQINFLYMFGIFDDKVRTLYFIKLNYVSDSMMVKYYKNQFYNNNDDSILIENNLFKIYNYKNVTIHYYKFKDHYLYYFYNDTGLFYKNKTDSHITKKDVKKYLNDEIDIIKNEIASLEEI